MGCGASSVRVSNQPQSQRTRTLKPSQTVMTVDISSDAEERLKKSFDIMMKDISKIALPSNQMTIVCLTNDAFPILCDSIDSNQNYDEDSEETEEEDNQNSSHLKLPIIAASYSKSGRLVCYSQLTYLTNNVLQNESTMKLVTRTINWLCDGKVGDSPIGIFTSSEEMNKTIVQCLKKLNMNPIEDTSLQTDLSNSKLVILTSDLDTSDPRLYSKLIEFTMGGGGIIVFYNHSADPKLEINSFLRHYGLSYSSKLIHQDEDDNLPLIDANTDFDKMKIHNFIYVKEMITELLDSDKPDFVQLDSLITEFRYYMKCADERQDQSLQDVANYAWDYLIRTKYSENDKICNDVRQCIVIALILDLYQKLPLRLTAEIPETRVFPGIPGDVNLTYFSKQIDMPDTSWVSTGLYLPPGQIGTVKSPDSCPELIIQVGSHNDSLLNKEFPWKRWPMITVGFSVIEAEIEIGTQFGGIVYIYSEDGSIEGIDLEFANFCEYPYYSHKDKSIWERTKDIPVPFGEIEANSIIFTLPVSHMKKLDMCEICTKFNKMHHEILNFLSSPLLHQDRIIFDIDTPSNDKYCGYPIYENIDIIEPLFNNLGKPNILLFNLLVRIATVDIRENSFDSEIERSFSTVAACLGLQAIFSDFSPSQFEGEFEFPPLFEEFWKIHSKNKTWIPSALSKIQDPQYSLSDVPEDTFIVFVREMGNISKFDFTKYLDKIYPIPLNITDNLENLPPFTE